MTNAPPGWLSDPTGRHQHRYWDGSKWTDQVADNGVSATDPVTPTPTPTSTADEAGVQPAQPSEPGPTPTNLTPPGDTPELTPPTTPAQTMRQPGQEPQPQPQPQPTGAGAGGPGGWSPAGGGPSGAPSAPPSSSGPSTPLLVALAGLVVVLFAAIVFVLMDDGDDETATDSTTTTEAPDESTTTTADTTSTTIGDDPLGMDGAVQQLSTEFDITEEEARCMIGEAAAWMVTNGIEPSAEFTFDELTGEQQAAVFSEMLTCVDADDLVSSMIETALEGTYTADEAECIGDTVVANIDAEELMAGAFTNPEDPVSELSPEDQASFQDAVDQCTT